jgi:RNA polymerase sigma-70 factor, ECF subfamily
MTWPLLTSPDEFAFRAERSDVRRMNLTPVKPVRTPVALSDEALVVAGRNGDVAALDALFARFAKMVHGLAFRLVGTDSEVDDIVQDAFVEALTHLHRLEEPAAFRGWLKSIVVRTTCKRLRRRRLLTRLGLRRPEPIELDALPIANSAPAEVVAELRLIFSLIDELPVQERVALVLHRVEGMTLPEVAEQMKLSLTTVKRRIAAAEQAVSQRRPVEVGHV